MSATTPPRVLFVGAFPPPDRLIFGGMVSSCRSLLASSFPRRVALDLLDSTQRSNPPPRLAVRLLWAVVRLARFVTHLERGRPQAVLLFVAIGASVIEKGAMAWYARLRGVPALIFPRGGGMIDACRTSRVAAGYTRWALRGACTILCQSESWRTFVTQELGFAPATAVVVNNWTASRELLSIGACRTPRGQAAVRLIFVGWLEREKGVFELLEACQRLRATHEFTLELVGDGHAAAQLRAVVAREGLEGIVSFRGWLAEEGVREALAECDVLVLPSWAEGLPNAMIEAMAVRLAIVVSRVGAVPDVIRHGESGLLVEPRDVRSLQTALAEVIENADLRERLAAEGYLTAAAKFSVEPAVDRLVSEIENVVAGTRAARGLAS